MNNPVAGTFGALDSANNAVTLGHKALDETHTIEGGCTRWSTFGFTAGFVIRLAIIRKTRSTERSTSR